MPYKASGWLAINFICDRCQFLKPENWLIATVNKPQKLKTFQK